MTKDNGAAQLQQLLSTHPNDFRVYSSGDDINAENLESNGPFENSDPQIIELIGSALATGKQVAMVAAGATKVLLMIAKPGTRLFDGPPGTKQSAYKALVVEGNKFLLMGTQAKLGGNHEQGKLFYKDAIVAFEQAEKLRPNEASPKLGIAEASAHMWEDCDPEGIRKKIEEAEQFLLQGLSKNKVNKFGGMDKVHYLYALCHLALKNRDVAKEHLRQTIAINPDHQFAPGILKTVEEQDAKKSGCFIATAAYGSPLAPEVEVLRKFRDEVLRRSILGRLFIRIYSVLSPPVAKLIWRSDFSKAAIRQIILSPILRRVKARWRIE